MPKTLSSPTFPCFFPINSLKLFPLSKQNKKSLIKPDIFDFKPFPTSFYSAH